jgi:hypothetical protein
MFRSMRRSRTDTRVRSLALTSLALLGLSIATADARAEPLDLRGTWFVLIHYRDPETANPDATRWKDFVWVFAERGSRLEWTQYPIVVFDDETGRFESLGNNPRSRVLAGWEPDAAQLQTLADGPQVNPRGKLSKTLRGSDAKGWKSVDRMAATSASVMGYQENITIDRLDGLPRFVREDVVGNALSASKGGGTRYEVEVVEQDGQRLRGRYERDGRQQGTFQMWRTAPTRGLPIKDENSEKDGETRGGALPPGFDESDFE